MLKYIKTNQTKMIKLKNIFRLSKTKLIILSSVLFFISFSASCAGLYIYVRSHRVSQNETKIQQTSETPKKTDSTPAATATTPKTTTPPPVAKPKAVAAKVVTPAPQSSVDSLKTTSTSSPTTPPSTPPTTEAPARTSSIRYSSTNWSGYLATGGNFTTVSGSWQVPSVTGTGTGESADGSWIGIGGVTSGDLIQVGTANYVTAAGEVSSAAFYEILPASAEIIPSITVSSGDSISASITETSLNQWSVVINNLTNGQSFSINLSYVSSHSSAEWIEEAPSYASGGLVPLNYFGTVSFSNCTSTVDGYSYSVANIGPSSVTMVTGGGTPIAVPSSISGTGFSVTRQ
jgi:hypothetical protein